MQSLPPVPPGVRISPEPAGRRDTPPRLDNVARIAVLRPNAVGDFVFALPALHALKHAYPDAELVYIGKEWHAQFLRGRPGPVDRVLVLPPLPGIGVPAASAAMREVTADTRREAKWEARHASEDGTGRRAAATREQEATRNARQSALEEEMPAAKQNAMAELGQAAHSSAYLKAHLEARPAATREATQDVKQEAAPGCTPCARFLAQMRDERIDIALQMFGGGRFSNPFVAQFGARLTVGARAADALPLDRWCAYVEPGNRRLALLEIAQLAGAAVLPLHPELAVTDADRGEAGKVLPPVPGRRLALLQPGASDPRRRWPAARFAAVGDALAAQGVLVAINGTAQEAATVRQVRAAMRHEAADLAGKLSLGGLCGLLERAAVVVSNDTGPLHLALAIGTPCVGIFWHTNLADGMPLRPSLLRAAVSARLHCPVCGLDNRAMRCAHANSFVDDVQVAEVVNMARATLGGDGHEACPAC